MAIAAVERNSMLLYPWVSCVENIEGSYTVLLKTCGKEATLDIISKNPGVLGCDASRLARSSPAEIQRVADAIAILQVLTGTPFVAIALVIISLAFIKAVPGVSDALPPGAADAADGIARSVFGVVGASAFIAAVTNAVYVSSKAPPPHKW
eukprot:scaffold82443_cov32-Tisochrysis_lutea.AAC.2